MAQKLTLGDIPVPNMPLGQSVYIHPTASNNTLFGPISLPRRGQPRHHVIVWLEREDEVIPPPWTDCVTHRFFNHTTASFGVIVESPDIPWMVEPGMGLGQHPSWEALDITIRQHTLNEVARTLPNLREPQEAAYQFNQYDVTLTPGSLAQWSK